MISAARLTFDLLSTAQASELKKYQYFKELTVEA
jgi:hypothetical protein